MPGTSEGVILETWETGSILKFYTLNIVSPRIKSTRKITTKI
jgi:hypothetical protein